MVWKQSVGGMGKWKKEVVMKKAVNSVAFWTLSISDANIRVCSNKLSAIEDLKVEKGS